MTLHWVLPDLACLFWWLECKRGEIHYSCILKKKEKESSPLRYNYSLISVCVRNQKTTEKLKLRPCACLPKTNASCVLDSYDT
ncbi:hypothetical protein Syun_004671 [Stephania yunnanensis]|uniref:Secreted protein n=1 Tax=Stephania yunnanensis TaxID=152371 RepID=A0AAP0L7M7_9MAGN